MIILYSLPVVWFSLLDVGSYNFAAYISRDSVFFNNRSDLDGAILNENGGSLVLWLNANFRTGFRKRKFGEKPGTFDLLNAKK